MSEESKTPVQIDLPNGLHRRLRGVSVQEGAEMRFLLPELVRQSADDETLLKTAVETARTLTVEDRKRRKKPGPKPQPPPPAGTP